MAKAFSVASWNVEHFGKTTKNSDKPKKPVGPIVDYLASQKADIVAVYEVVGKMVFSEVMKKMPGYQFHITEGLPNFYRVNDPALTGIPGCRIDLRKNF